MFRKVESFENLKNTAINGRLSRDTMETKIKKEFRERLKELRRRNIDSRREDIAKTLLHMKIESQKRSSFFKEYYSYEESLSLVQEIEEELRLEALNQQADIFQQDCENEISYFVNLYDSTI